MKNELILIPALELPLSDELNKHNDIEVWLTLEEAKQAMKELGAGTYVWAEPTDYNCSKTVLDFLNGNMILAQEVRLKVLGVY